jgi:large subunit ribosomal protein L30
MNMSEKKQGTIKIRLIRSGIGSPEKLKLVLEGLGLRKLQRVVEKPDNAGIRGMIAKVCHLVEVVE